jgi:hypothetical protein
MINVTNQYLFLCDCETYSFIDKLTENEGLREVYGCYEVGPTRETEKITCTLNHLVVSNFRLYMNWRFVVQSFINRAAIRA